MKGFKRFLVDSPLVVSFIFKVCCPKLINVCCIIFRPQLNQFEKTSSPLFSYGTHHARYLLDGELIAFAVLDILPGAVSSVYFVWSPRWAGMGLGKLSALREIEMCREMERAGVTCPSYMMGELYSQVV